MVIRYNNKMVTQYFLIYLMYMLHNSVLCNLNIIAFTSITFAIGFIIILFYKIRVSIRLYISLGLLLINVLFVRFISGGVGLNAYIFWASMLVITYAAYFIEPDNFIERYSNLVLFFSAVSLFFWSLTQIVPNIVRKLTIFHLPNPDYSYSIFDGLLLYVTRDNVTRNVSVFGEPGLFQILLNTALFFSLFEADKLSWNPKKRTFAIIIFILAIISAQSTTGYIAMAVIVGVYLISHRDEIKGRFILLTASIAGILLFNFIITGNDSFISSVIINKLINTSGKIDISAGSGYWRMVMMNVSLESLIQNPFGCGYNIAHMLIRKQAPGQTGNALFVEIMALGIEFIGVLIYCLLVPAYKNRKNILMFLLIIFLYINTAIAQSNVFYPALVVLCIIKFQEVPQGGKI